MEIAVYGKGGIGKSTVSANLSASLARRGRSVLQIGCDPKHDSTRLLLHGGEVPTVLEYLRDTPKEDAQISAILHEGLYGVGCIEAGGPKPGVGCAGRGIISAFEFLERNKVKDRYDIVLYDVLGDVVCGGFAVPIRREYADAVFLVTSGEFMAIYAANNILRGIRNFDGDRFRRVAGIILNERNIEDESERAERFAAAVSLPIVARIPRSDAFAEAERKKVPVAALPGYPDVRQCFTDLAKCVSDDMPLYTANPLSDGLLERIVLGTADAGTGAAVPVENTFPEESGPEDAAPAPESAERGLTDGIEEELLPSSRASRPPLYGCAFNGAAVTAIRLTDAVVIAHSPRSCAFFTWQTITSPGRKNLFNRGIVIPSAVKPYLECTEITHAEAVFGGTDKLLAHVKDAVARKPGAVIVITSCVSGIIGDDVQAAQDLSTPEVPVILVPADGDVAGDYMEGIRMCLHAVADTLIDRDTPKEERSVNLIGEIGVSNNLEYNYRMIRDALAAMDIRINCRFLGGSTVSEVRRLTAAPLNILATGSADNLALKDYLAGEYGCIFAENTIPTGFDATAGFLREIAGVFHCGEKAEAVIAGAQKKYRRAVDELRGVLAGKRILMTTIAVDMDWLFTAALDAGMTFVYVGVADYLEQGEPVSGHEEILAVSEMCLDLGTAVRQVKALSPDLVVSNYTSAFGPGDYVLDTMPMTVPAGFYSGIDTLRRWAAAFSQGEEGEWIHDRAMYEKFFA